MTKREREREKLHRKNYVPGFSYFVQNRIVFSNSFPFLYGYFFYFSSSNRLYLSSSSKVYAIRAAPFSTVAQVDPKCEGALPVIGLAKHLRCRCRETIRNIATASESITAVSTPITIAMYVGSSCFAVETGSSPSVAPFFSTKTSL